MNQVYIGIGSNQNHPIYRVNKAIKEINHFAQTSVIKKSSLYETSPLGPKLQPNFINAVIEIRTNLKPDQLLFKLQGLEKLHNRKKTKRWGPRSIDLDILIYNKLIMKSKTLTLPHPGVEYREFVLLPLYEITKYGYEVPLYGKVVSLIKNI